MQLLYNKKKKCWKAKIMSTEQKRAHSWKKTQSLFSGYTFVFCHGKVHWPELISRCQMIICFTFLISDPNNLCLYIWNSFCQYVNEYGVHVYTWVHVSVCVLALPLLRVAELFMSAVMKDDSDCFLTVSFHILRIRLWQQRKRGGRFLDSEQRNCAMYQ